LNKIFNIAIIGCGAISQTHINSLEKLDICEIKTVCDIDDRASISKADGYNYKTLRDYKEVLSDNSIDAVHILTPHNLHTSIAVEALLAGKHVLLEKPAGISFEELNLLKETEKRSTSKISVVFQNRYNNTTVKMKELIDGGSLGAFKASKAIVAWHRDDDYYMSSKWRGRWSTEGGGLLINQAIHTLDLLRYLGGEVDAVKGNVQNTCHDIIEVEDVAMATYYYKNGAIGNFYGTNNHGINSNIEIELIYENGILHLINEKLYLINNEGTIVKAEDIILKGAKSYWGISHDACIRSFYQNLLNEKDMDITLMDASVTNEIVLGIYKSSKTNEKYYINGGNK
jgi:predicted dehydrogenase